MSTTSTSTNRYDYSPIIERPRLVWPKNTRLAIYVVLFVEYWDITAPGLTITSVASNTVPDVINFSWREYGARHGIWRLMKILDKHKIRATVALNGAVCEKYPIIVRETKKRNWEFMGHCYTQVPLSYEKNQREIIRKTIDAISHATEKPPRGWMGASLAETLETPDILAEEGIEFLCDWVNDDQPYSMRVKKNSLFSLPFSVETSDITTFATHHGTSEVYYQTLKDQFDVLYEEGKENGKVMSIGLHPFLSGVPHRSKYVDEALAYITKHDDIWLATGSEIIDHYKESVH